MITVGDAPVLELHMSFPERGAWRAQVSCSFAPTYAAQISDGERSYRGTVINSGVVGGRWDALIVGGSGGLSGEIQSKNYQFTTALAVASDICSDAGESYSPLSDPSVVSRSLPNWSRAKTTARAAMDVLCDDIGADWIVSEDGFVTLKSSGYTETNAGNALILDANLATRALTVAPDSLWLRPGMSLNGMRVKRVVYYQGNELRAIASV